MGMNVAVSGDVVVSGNVVATRGVVASGHATVSRDDAVSRDRDAIVAGGGESAKACSLGPYQKDAAISIRHTCDCNF